MGESSGRAARGLTVASSRGAADSFARSAESDGFAGPTATVFSWPCADRLMTESEQALAHVSATTGLPRRATLSGDDRPWMKQPLAPRSRRRSTYATSRGCASSPCTFEVWLGCLATEALGCLAAALLGQRVIRPNGEGAAGRHALDVCCEWAGRNRVGGLVAQRAFRPMSVRRHSRWPAPASMWRCSTSPCCSSCDRRSARAAAGISWPPPIVRLRQMAASGIQPKWLICHSSQSRACSSSASGGLRRPAACSVLVWGGSPGRRHPWVRGIDELIGWCANETFARFRCGGKVLPQERAMRTPRVLSLSVAAVTAVQNATSISAGGVCRLARARCTDDRDLECRVRRS